jgi:hypothetical protein
MSIRFSPLLTVGVRHAYYTDAVCRDLGFFAPPGNGVTLRAGKLLVRELDGMLHVLYEADESNAPLSSIAAQILYFGLRLNNMYFDNFTAPVIPPASSPLPLTPFYGNSIAPGTLDAPIGVQLAAGLYAHTPQETTRPVTLSLSDNDGHIVATQVLTTPGEAGAFDLRGLPRGIWNIGEDYGGGVTRSRQLFVDPDLRDMGGMGIWGLLAIKIDAAFYATPPAFSIVFTPREESLKYYVVANNFNPAEFAQLNVIDAGFTDEGRPELKFNKKVSDLAPALLGGDGASIALFESQTAIARRQKGLRKIHLNRNGDVLIEHLPQPGPDRSQAQQIIHLSKP